MNGDIKYPEADPVCSLRHSDVKYLSTVLSVLSLFRSITFRNEDASQSINVAKFTFKFFMMHLDLLHLLDIFLPWISDMKTFPDTVNGGWKKKRIFKGKKKKLALSFINHYVHVKSLHTVKYCIPLVFWGLSLWLYLSFTRS